MGNIITGQGYINKHNLLGENITENYLIKIDTTDGKIYSMGTATESNTGFCGVLNRTGQTGDNANVSCARFEFKFNIATGTYYTGELVTTSGIANKVTTTNATTSNMIGRLSRNCLGASTCYVRIEPNMWI